MAWSGATVAIGNYHDTRDAFASEQLTVTTAAVSSGTAATYNPSQNTESGAGATGINLPAQQMLVTQQTATNSVNFTIDGTTPTTGVAGNGHVMSTGDNVVINGINNIKNFKAIATTGTCTLYITYLR